MWEALEALNHDLERDHLVGIVAAGSMSRRAYALPVARRQGGDAAEPCPGSVLEAGILDTWRKGGCPLPYFKASGWAIGEP
jgi:hypothetical protein